MDFFKYLIGFNEYKKYSKIIFPSTSTSIKTEYDEDTVKYRSWTNFFQSGKLNNLYYYCVDRDLKTELDSINGEAPIVQLTNNDRTFASTNTTSLGNILLSGTSTVPLVQEVWGPLNLLYGAYTDNINCTNGQGGFSFYNTKTIEAADAKITTGSIRLTNTTLSVNAAGPVSATYFNATSDRRAKTNIAAYKGNATELVKKIPIYTFNYLASNSPSIGMIAQEAAIFDNVIPNFSLVSNERATGEDGDYMSIKESKLVYILWKAVQEQAAKIEELQKKVDALSNN